MGLTLVLEVNNIIIYNFCKYIKYNNLSMYKFKTLFLCHVSIYLHVNCTHNRMAQKLYNTKFLVINMIEIVINDN